MPYVQSTVSVNSATVPVSLIPPSDKVSWVIKPRAGGAVPILIFFYSGALPGVAPAALFEVAPGVGLSDGDYTMSYRTDAMTAGIAAVLESGAVAVVTDAIYKT